MATKQGHGTGIEWTHLPGYKGMVWNPAVGCTPAAGSERGGCLNCYARVLHERRRADNQYANTLARLHPESDVKLPWPPQYDTPFAKVQLLPERLEQPLHWRKPRAVFVDSMTDLFHEDVPDEFIGAVFAVMSMVPRHLFMVLTKRPERMWLLMRHAMFKLYVNAARMRMGVAVLPDSRRADGTYAWPLPNAWLGVSVEDQATADERIPLLLDTPAAVRFVSAEPLLGPIDFWRANSRGFDNFDWLICGGESGKGHRDLNLAWAASIYEYCQETEVPWFGKQRSGTRPGLPLPAPYDAKAWPEVTDAQR